MNVVIFGPFGLGSLTDEAVLAGILRHLEGAKHRVTVLTADVARTQAMHKCFAAELESPGQFLSARDAWTALGEAHLFILTGAGVLNAEGKPAARVWLLPFEHVNKLKIKTMVVGVGATEIGDAKERVRLQRLLHGFTSSISVRDEVSKTATMSYGMHSQQVAANGDPILALRMDGATRPPATPRVGLILASHVPTRAQFSYVEQPPDAALQSALKEFAALIAADKKLELHIFHDDNNAATTQARALAGEHARVKLHAANQPIEKLQKELAQCGVVFSLPVQGLVLAAGCGAAIAGLDSEPGAADLLKVLGCDAGIIPASGEAFDAGVALKTARGLLESGSTLRETIKTKLTALAKREAQIGRTLELLVPKRDRYPARPEKPRRKRRKSRAERVETDRDPWLTDERFE